MGGLRRDRRRGRITRIGCSGRQRSGRERSVGVHDPGAERWMGSCPAGRGKKVPTLLMLLGSRFRN